VAGSWGRFCLGDEWTHARRTFRRENRHGVRLRPRYSSRRQTTQEGDLLRYALLAYQNVEVRDRRAEEEQRRINAGVAEVLARPNVAGWLRLQDFESATTLRQEQGSTLLTDGPFVDSKDYLGGFIVVEADNLDEALSVARELQELTDASAIEIRPIREEPLVGA
jgi:hypothetical protein